MTANTTRAVDDRLSHLKRLAGLAGIDDRDLALPDSHHVILGGRRFHCLSWGSTSLPPVLLLHGGNQSAHTWDVVCLALSRRYHCVALDQRGHGDSEWSYEFDYGPDAHAGDVERLVDHLGWSRFVIAGMSMGCLNALQFSATRPERVAGFVAIDAGPYIERGGGEAIVDFVEANRHHETLDGFVDAAMQFNPRRRPEFLRHSLLHTVRRLSDGSFAWRADRRRPFNIADMEHWLAGVPAMLPRITCPTLVVRGAESKVLSHEGQTRFARELPDGRAATVPDAGHTVQGDNPTGLVAVLEPFLGSLSWR
jgi:pimeloyl-ACP methyl ester carboxylesterase